MFSPNYFRPTSTKIIVMQSHSSPCIKKVRNNCAIPILLINTERSYIVADRKTKSKKSSRIPDLSHYDICIRVLDAIEPMSHLYSHYAKLCDQTSKNHTSYGVFKHVSPLSYIQVDSVRIEIAHNSCIKHFRSWMFSTQWISARISFRNSKFSPPVKPLSKPEPLVVCLS